MPAGIDLLLAVAEAGAEDAGDALVPGQLDEGLGVGNADQLGGLRAIADIVLVAVDEEIGGRAIDQLEAPLGDALPMIGRHALADDATRDGNELVVDVLDPQLLDLLPDLLHQLFAAFGVNMNFQVGHVLPLFSVFSLSSLRSIDRSVPRPRSSPVSFARLAPREGAVGGGMQPAFGEAREAEGLEELAALPADILGDELADADHLVAMVRISDHIDVV